MGASVGFRSRLRERDWGEIVWVSMALGLVAAYVASPIDFIPEFIPILGVTDDLALMGGVLTWVARSVPGELISGRWRGEGDVFQLLREIRALVRCFWRGG